MSDETPTIAPALTPEEWARDANAWMTERCAGGEIPRHALAALCLHEQPYGFMRADVEELRWASNQFSLPSLADIAARINALLPPEG